MKVNVPKDFLLGPVFTATPQAGPRSVTVGKRHYQIGGFHPLDPAKSPRGLDIRHARALFTLLSFRSIYPGSPLVRFSMREFSKRWCRSYGGLHARALRVLLGDLLDTYFRVRDIGTGITHTYRLIERIDIESKPRRGRRTPRAADGNMNPEAPALWFDTITLSSEFRLLLDSADRVQPFELGAVSGMRSRLAQAIYLYLPSRAYHHTAADPFSIKLMVLLEQIGHPIPATARLRRKLFTQRRTSILAQLDGTRTLTGQLRVALERTTDGSDWKLNAWLEGANRLPRQPSRSKLIAAFLRAGRSEKDLANRLARARPLDEYEIRLLELGRVDFQSNLPCFTLAKALLGEDQFRGLAAEAKAEVIEGRPPRQNETARLISRCMRALEARKAPGTPRGPAGWRPLPEGGHPTSGQP